MNCIQHGGLIVGGLDSGSSSAVSSPGQVHFFLFLGKTLNSLNSFHPGVKMGTNKFNAGGNCISSRG